MVRPTVVLAVSALVGLMAAAPAFAAQEEKNADATSSGPTAETPTPAQQKAERPVDRDDFSCELCAMINCNGARLSSRCAEDEDADAPEQLWTEIDGSRDGIRGSLHLRDRSISAADYEPLVLDDFPDVDRAETRPARRPHGGIDPDLKVLQINDSDDGNVIERGSTEAADRAFRPLNLRDKTPENANEEKNDAEP